MSTPLRCVNCRTWSYSLRCPVCNGPGRSRVGSGKSYAGIWRGIAGEYYSRSVPQCDLPGGDNRTPYAAEQHADGVHAMLVEERESFHRCSIGPSLELLHTMPKDHPNYKLTVAIARYFNMRIKADPPDQVWANAYSAVVDTDTLLCRLVKEEWDARRPG